MASSPLHLVPGGWSVAGPAHGVQRVRGHPPVPAVHLSEGLPLQTQTHCRLDTNSDHSKASQQSLFPVDEHLRSKLASSRLVSAVPVPGLRQHHHHVHDHPPQVAGLQDWSAQVQIHSA